MSLMRSPATWAARPCRCGLCMSEPGLSPVPGPGRGRYGPLRAYLAARDGGEVRMTFAVPYVDSEVTAAVAARAEALGYQTAKLVRLIEELNDSYRQGNTYAAHALLRAVLDHIPPLLGCGDFPAVVSSQRWSRTDSSYVRKLRDFRLQASDVLHRPISRKADLLGLDDMPPRIWINRLLQECTDRVQRDYRPASWQRACVLTGSAPSPWQYRCHGSAHCPA